MLFVIESVHTTFVRRRGKPVPVHTNDKPMPNSDTAKNLGLIFDKGPTWAKHVRRAKLKFNRRPGLSQTHSR